MLELGGEFCLESRGLWWGWWWVLLFLFWGHNVWILLFLLLKLVVYLKLTTHLLIKINSLNTLLLLSRLFNLFRICPLNRIRSRCPRDWICLLIASVSEKIVIFACLVLRFLVFCLKSIWFGLFCFGLCFWRAIWTRYFVLKGLWGRNAVLIFSFEGVQWSRKKDFYDSFLGTDFFVEIFCSYCCIC